MLRTVFPIRMGGLFVRTSSIKSAAPPALNGRFLICKPGDAQWAWGEQSLSGFNEFD